MKTALVTGANKSIGFEIVKQLLDLGYYVFLGSRDLEKGAEAVARLKSDKVEVIQIDVSDAASVMAARTVIGQKTDSLDALVNNAGVSGGFPQSPTTLDTEVIRNVFETNFFGTINVTMAFLDLLKKSDAPRIVNVTSGLASLTLHNDPSWKYYNFKGGAYGPSKTALNAYTIALAFELKDSPFKINVVDPGFTATDFNNYRGTGSVPAAAARIVKYATVDENGLSGQYFSDDNNPEAGVSPW
ncbi:MAG: family oxidoreductase [Mucilaginibacter sp.]|nr:family oxidoreductase [Mucilaginibacter sp.]